MNTLDKRIEKYCEENHISGIIRVTVKDEIKYQKSVGFSDFENRIPFDENSMFTFYSLTKPFTAIGLLKLRDKGLIDIDVHPKKYLPEAAGFDERVTIRHMLHHTSGLPDFLQTEDFIKKYPHSTDCDMRKKLKIISSYSQYFAPNTSGRYTNIPFTICALIIENVSGMEYSEYMQKEVFAPLGMKTARIDNENLFVENRVKGYELSDGAMFEVGKAYDYMFGAGDAIGTADDVYCLNRAIKNGKILKSETWNEILTPSPLNKMGMGCTVYDWHGKLRITHNGGSSGFRTFHLQLLDDDFDIIFLSNSGFGNARDDIAEIIHDAFYGADNLIIEPIAMDVGYI